MMRTYAIDNNYAPTMMAGLYFTKTSNVLFNKNPNIKYATDELVKVSKEGSRYIEDTNISQAMKKRFSKIPFIRKLAEQFDTFVHFHETPKGSATSKFKHISYAKISWADYSKKSAETRDFVGMSPFSQESATNEMFKKLTNTQLN